MAGSTQSIPSYMKFLRCALCSHDFECLNPLYYPITLPKSGLTMCRQCIGIIREETKCPNNHGSVGTNYIPIDELPTNYSLLCFLDDKSELPKDHRVRHSRCRMYSSFDVETKEGFKMTEECFDKISILIKPILKDEKQRSIFNDIMVEKIFGLLCTQYINKQVGSKILAAIASLVNDLSMDLIGRYQNPQLTTTQPACSSLTTELKELMKAHRTPDKIVCNLQLLSEAILDIEDNNSWPKVKQAIMTMQDFLQYFITLASSHPR